MNYSVGRCELQNLGTTPQTHAAQGGYKVLCRVVLHRFHSRFSQFMSTRGPTNKINFEKVMLQ